MPAKPRDKKAALPASVSLSIDFPNIRWNTVDATTFRVTLDLENDPRVIEMSTANLGAPEHRHTREDAQALHNLLAIELTPHNPKQRLGEPFDWTWAAANARYFSTVLVLSNVLAATRTLIAPLCRFIDDDPDRAAQRVTTYHLELGLDANSTAFAAICATGAAFDAIVHALRVKKGLI